MHDDPAATRAVPTSNGFQGAHGRLFYLCTGTIHLPGLLAGEPTLRAMRLPVRAGVFLDPEAGPVILDTGLISLAHACRRTGKDSPAGAALRAGLAGLGLTPENVGHVVLTGLTPGSLGGLALFPRARLHMSGLHAEQVARGAGPRDLLDGLPRAWLPDDAAARTTPAETARAVPVMALSGEGYDLLGTGRLILAHLPAALSAPGLPGASVVFARTDRGPVIHAGQAAWTAPQARQERNCRPVPGFCPARLRHAQDRRGQAARILDGMRQGTARLILATDPETHPEDLFTHGKSGDRGQERS